MAGVEVRVEGLAQLRRALGQLDPLDARNELRDGLKAAANIVAEDAQRRVPTRSGRARASLRATAGGNRAYVVGGRASVPYYGWLDFGGRNPVRGRSRSVGPWAKSGGGPSKGRFIYPALDAREREVVSAVSDATEKAIKAVDLY